jgi:tellurium resistance protein TerZ
MAKLVRDGTQWKLRAIGEGVAITKPTEALELLRRFL